MPYFIKYFKNCDTFDNVQYILHTKKSKMLRSYHLLLICQYATWTCSASDNNFNSVKFDWNSVDSGLMPYKRIAALPTTYTVTCG